MTSTALAVADTAQTTLGARATAMGGAFTAVADDTTAYYWNPAGVARAPFVRVGGFWGDGFGDRGGLIEHLRSQSPGDEACLVGDRAWGFATGITVLGVAVSRFTYTQSVLEGSDIHSRGLTTWDVAVTFVQSLPPDDLVVGVNVRYIRGTVFSEMAPMTDYPEGRRDVKDVVNRAVGGLGQTGSQPGVDFGIVYQPNAWLRLGLAARNLNRPTFQTENGVDISLERHARAGAAFLLPRDLVVAVDVDLASREYPADDHRWRELSVGVEKSWANQAITLRGGLRSEVGERGWTRPGWAGGIGVRFKDMFLDISAMTGTESRLGALWFGASFQR